MTPEEIKTRLQDNIEDCVAEVSVDGSHILLQVVSPAFEGLTPVKKQQMVYAVVQDAIASGAVHAVQMKTYTPEEWAKVSAG